MAETSLRVEMGTSEGRGRTGRTCHREIDSDKWAVHSAGVQHAPLY